MQNFDGGALIQCRGKNINKCAKSKKNCLWTSRGYCRKRGMMNCRGKTPEQCANVRINIPGLVPPVRGRCKYTRGPVRNSCRRIRHYTRKTRGTRKNVNRWF